LYYTDRLGRKPVILAASVVFTIGSIVMGAADGKEGLLAGRIIVGVGIGKDTQKESNESQSILPH
jgi:SP family myo-inositol transporter-like MFS transporter 13